MTLLLQAHDLEIAKNARVILGPLSVSISAGEKIAVVGNNGSGKTTLLRALAGLQRVRAGTLQQQTQRLSYMPDLAPVDAHVSVHDLLCEWALLRGADAQTIAPLLQQLDLSTVADRSCARLSLGFRQRVALAMSLLPQPDLLLLDEPANGLDPHHQHLLLQLLQQFAGTLLVVTHHLATWQSHCTRVLALNNGELIFDGSMHDYVNSAVYVGARHA